MLEKIKSLFVGLNNFFDRYDTEVRYLSVPIWRPWRDY
jgi:hypothetical protein